MYQGEVLYRQGWWVRRFPTQLEATLWALGQLNVSRQAANPGQRMNVKEQRERNTIRG